MHQYVLNFPGGFQCELNLGLSGLCHFCSYSIGQTESHGPDQTLREPGKCSLYVCPGVRIERGVAKPVSLC